MPPTGAEAEPSTTPGTLNLTDSTLVNNAVTTVASVTGLGTSSSPGGGGGIDNLGTMTVTNSTLVSNTAPIGGAIDNVGTLTVVDSTLASNAAPTGGGIDNVSPGQLVLENYDRRDQYGHNGSGPFGRRQAATTT